MMPPPSFPSDIVFGANTKRSPGLLGPALIAGVRLLYSDAIRRGIRREHVRCHHHARQHKRCETFFQINPHFVLPQDEILNTLKRLVQNFISYDFLTKILTQT